MPAWRACNLTICSVTPTMDYFYLISSCLNPISRGRGPPGQAGRSLKASLRTCTHTEHRDVFVLLADETPAPPVILPFGVGVWGPSCSTLGSRCVCNARHTSGPARTKIGVFFFVPLPLPFFLFCFLFPRAEQGEDDAIYRFS